MADWKHHFKRAVNQLGSQPKLAAAMGCSQSKISWLLQKPDNYRMDADDALAVHRATNGDVPASAIRPDIWPTPECVPLKEPERAQ